MLLSAAAAVVCDVWIVVCGVVRLELGLGEELVGCGRRWAAGVSGWLGAYVRLEILGDGVGRCFWGSLVWSRHGV